MGIRDAGCWPIPLAYASVRNPAPRCARRARRRRSRIAVQKNEVRIGVLSLLRHCVVHPSDEDARCSMLMGVQKSPCHGPRGFAGGSIRVGSLRHPCLRVQLLLPRARISSVRPTRPRSPAGWSRLGPAARIYPHIIQPSTNRDRISRRDPSELTLWPSAVWTRKPRRCSLPLTRPIAVFVYPGLHSNFPGRTIGPL